jgi:hypothetical protein
LNKCILYARNKKPAAQVFTNDSILSCAKLTSSRRPSLAKLQCHRCWESRTVSTTLQSTSALEQNVNDWSRIHWSANSCLPSVGACLTSSVYCSRIVCSNTTAFAGSGARIGSTDRGLSLANQTLSDGLRLVVLERISHQRKLTIATARNLRDRGTRSAGQTVRVIQQCTQGCSCRSRSPGQGTMCSACL